MKINDVIKLSCDFLGLSELKALVGTENGSELEKEKLSSLLTSLNLAYEEIITEYLPILKTERVSAVDGEVKYSSLSFPVSGITSVKDLSGAQVGYSLSADHINTKEESVEITYQISPSKLDFGQEINVLFPERILGYGTAREYLFMQGMNDDAIIYDTRFKDALVNFVRKKAIKKMPKRAWKI